MLKPRHQACRNPGHRGDQRQPQHVPGYDPVARRWRRSGAVAALALGLAAAPVDLARDAIGIAMQVADAKQDGDNGGHGERSERGDNGHGEQGDHGGNRGGNSGRDGGDRGRTNEAGPAGQRGQGLGQGWGEGPRGSAHSLAVERAQERYAKATDGEATGRRDKGPGSDGFERSVGGVAHEFNLAETDALLARGWGGPKAFEDGFLNHGQRVSTMVEIAKALGYEARVGAMQGNFGTPFENGLYNLEVSLNLAQGQQVVTPEDTSVAAEIERLAGELAAAIGLAKPGTAPDDDWATVDLDVNGDLIVDAQDLQAARAKTAEMDQAADPEAKP